jgi:tetratricopeptide (TPR) repeat protein
MLLYQQIGDVQGLANSLNRLGQVAYLRGQHAAARDLCLQALDLFKKKQAVLGEANCAQALGDNELACGNLDAALTYFKLAQTLHSSIGSRLGEANCLQGIGDVAYARGDRNSAEDHYLSALRIYADIRQPYGVGQTSHRLAALTDGEERSAYLRAALAAWASIGRTDLIDQLHARLAGCSPRP